MLFRIILLAIFLMISTKGFAETLVLLQKTALAGSQYYALDTAWGEIREGDALLLQREAQNRHDARAVAVFWQGRQLGYLPRAVNAEAAAALDEGLPLKARITRLKTHPDPWQRLELEIFGYLEKPVFLDKVRETEKHRNIDISIR